MEAAIGLCSTLAFRMRILRRPIHLRRRLRHWFHRRMVCNEHIAVLPWQLMALHEVRTLQLVQRLHRMPQLHIRQHPEVLRLGRFLTRLLR